MDLFSHLTASGQHLFSSATLALPWFYLVLLRFISLAASYPWPSCLYLKPVSQLCVWRNSSVILATEISSSNIFFSNSVYLYSMLTPRISCSTNKLSLSRQAQLSLNCPPFLSCDIYLSKPETSVISDSMCPSSPQPLEMSAATLRKGESEQNRYVLELLGKFSSIQSYYHYYCFF